jgi:hypothetical protein
MYTRSYRDGRQDLFRDVGGYVGRLGRECAWQYFGYTLPTEFFAFADFQQEGLKSTLAQRDSCLFSAIANALTCEGGYLSPEFQEAVDDWLSIDPQDNDDPEVEALARSIAEGIRVQAFESYIADASERIHHEGGNKTRGFAVGMASWIESQTKKLSKRFPQPITR